MYKAVTLLVLIAAVAAITNALADGEHREGYCYVEGIYVKEGETVPAPIGKCYHLKCEDATEGKYMVSSLTCAAFVPRPGCYETEIDYSKPYPQCCPYEECDENYKQEVVYATLPPELRQSEN